MSCFFHKNRRHRNVGSPGGRNDSSDVPSASSTLCFLLYADKVPLLLSVRGGLLICYGSATDDDGGIMARRFRSPHLSLSSSFLSPKTIPPAVSVLLLSTIVVIEAAVTARSRRKRWD